MKRLDVSSVTSSVSLPLKSGSLQFLQDSHKEAMAGILKNIIEQPETDTIYILSGCENSATAPNHSLSPGVLYVNGEIYDFDGASFVLTGLQKAYARIETTQFLVNADPVEFTDGIQRNIHNIRKIVIENTTTSSGLPEFKDFITAGAFLKGDVKQVNCDNAYVNKYFDSTGLGRLERKGWAICNGDNGTANMSKRFALAYDKNTPAYATLGALAGTETHTLTAAELPTSVKGQQYGTNSQGHGSDTPILNPPVEVPLGGGQPHNNMPPYIVTLFIQKI
jgi:hypothetical protein